MIGVDFGKGLAFVSVKFSFEPNFSLKIAEKRAKSTERHKSLDRYIIAGLQGERSLQKEEKVFL